MLTSISAQYSLTVESSPALHVPGNTVYRFYVNVTDASDKFSAVFGNDNDNLIINTPAGIYNDPFNAGWSAAGINPLFLPSFPSLAEDSYATIGLDGPASTSGIAGAADPSLVEDATLPTTISEYFTSGGTTLNVNTLTGGSWYVLNTAGNALPTDLQVFVMQITTAGSISGTLNFQVFPLGVGVDQVQQSVCFDGAGTFYNCLPPVTGCTDVTACNYDPAATADDGSCAGIPTGDCDCAGNVADECGTCGGSGIAEGACDCDGNVLDACGVCGGDDSSCSGCTDLAASNYNVDSTIDDGSCLFATSFSVDMNCSDLAFGNVYVTGSWCGWCSCESYNSMTDGDADGVYAVTVDLPAGADFEYKYMVDCWAQQEDLIDDAIAGGACVANTDYFSYANRSTSVGSSNDDTYGSCLTCEEQALEALVAVTFNIDMNASDYPNGDYTNVVINGSWNGWNGWGVELADADGDGIWSATADFDPNLSIEFVVAVTGPADGWSGWGQIINAPEDCEVPGTGNYGLSWGEDDLTYSVCAGSCSETCPTDVEGCMDATACNFDAAATIQSGSFGAGSLNFEWTGQSSYFSEITYVVNGVTYSGNAAGDVSLDAGTYTVTGVDSWGDGWNGGELTITDAFSSVSVVLIVAGSEDSVSIEVTGGFTATGCEYESCAGCLDATACNYDDTATLDDGSCDVPAEGFDCEGNCVSGTLVSYTAGSYANENSFTISDCDGVVLAEMTSGSIGFNSCVELGENYSISLVDSWGDGWNGGSLSIGGVAYTVDDDAENNDDYSEVIGSCGVAGCMDASACNYNMDATFDDGSCDVPANGLDCDGNCLEGSNVTLTLYDSYGDGGGSVTINGDTYTLGGGASDDFTLCLDLSVCTEVLYAATDSWGYENSWALYIPDGLLASGEAESGTVGTCIDGCTDATACNYDDTANNEDDSCTYAEQYYDCMGDCINDSDGDGVCDELEIAGCVVPGACNYAIGVTDLAPCVYPDPGYLCDGTCDGDADGDGVCDDNEILGCQDATACNYNADATESDTCDYTTCLGCTDASACNYDATSTQEDGSCDYCSCDNAGGGQDGFGLELDAVSIDGSLTTYRLYVTTPDAGDFVSSISGNVNNPSFLRTTTSFAQSAVGGLTADLVNPLFFSSFPDLATDSWLTIGIDQAPAAGEGSISTAVAAGDTWGADFEAGGNLEINSFFGGSWFALNNVTNGFAGADNRVLVAQLTTDGNVTGSLYTQIFPGGDSSQELLLNLTFGATGCGCTDATACNYDATASYDDNDSCGYAEAGYDCDGNCLVDTDGDGVCDEFEVPGCMDTTACNYDEFADNDDSSCYYLELTDLPGGAPACGLFFSGYAEGSSNNKFLEIYNPTDSDISLDGYAYPSVSNAPSNPGVHEYWNAFDPGAVVAAGDVYVVSHGSADPAILAEADEFHTYLSNGDDGYALVQGDESSYVIVDMIGTWDADPGSGWEVAGVSNGTKDHSLIRKSDVISGNGGDWAASAGTDTDDSEWIVLDQNDWTGLGSHDFTGSCGGGAQAYVYDCDGECFNDADGDGVCDELEVAGCTDSGACNYDSAATDDDSSCEYLTCAGCTDEAACNYDDTATNEDGSCLYPDTFYNCDGSCSNDLNLNGICDELEVEGCMYIFSCNYDFEANIDDGSCEVDSCACPGDFNDDNEVDVSDLLDFFQLWGNVCE